jgi:hypothetical protein
VGRRAHPIRGAEEEEHLPTASSIRLLINIWRLRLEAGVQEDMVDALVKMWREQDDAALGLTRDHIKGILMVWYFWLLQSMPIGIEQPSTMIAHFKN